MKIITTTGFYGTGSSAITDLFSEMDNVCVKGDYEFRLFCDPDGLSDLEYNLIQNPNRHNTSNAIKRFKKQAEFLNGGKIIKRYNAFFENDFINATYRFIDEISEFKYIGRWHFDVYEKGKYFWIVSRVYSKLHKLVDQILNRGKEHEYSILPDNEMCYAGTLCEEKYLKATVNYTERLFEKFNINSSEFVFLDQLVPPTNLQRYTRYFSNITIYIVDRDPRDIYLLEKVYYKGKVAPVYDVKIFVKWYEWTRKQYELFSLPSNAKRIQFEDLIYNYNKTISDIIEFAGIDSSHHANKYKYLNPNISIKNTRLWIKHPEYSEDIAYIEKMVGKYCYAYD